MRFYSFNIAIPSFHKYILFGILSIKWCLGEKSSLKRNLKHWCVNANKKLFNIWMKTKKDSISRFQYLDFWADIFNESIPGVTFQCPSHQLNQLRCEACSCIWNSTLYKYNSSLNMIQYDSIWFNMIQYDTLIERSDAVWRSVVVPHHPPSSLAGVIPTAGEGALLAPVG